MPRLYTFLTLFLVKRVAVAQLHECGLTVTSQPQGARLLHDAAFLKHFIAAEEAKRSNGRKIKAKPNEIKQTAERYQKIKKTRV